MVLKTMLTTAALCVASVAIAAERTVTVDEPFVCLSESSINSVVYQYLRGQTELAKSYVEAETDCFVLPATDIPLVLVAQFEPVFADEQLYYGYLPLSVGIVTGYMFFMKIRSEHATEV